MRKYIHEKDGIFKSLIKDYPEPPEFGDDLYYDEILISLLDDERRGGAEIILHHARKFAESNPQLKKHLENLEFVFAAIFPDDSSDEDYDPDESLLRDAPECDL